MADASLAVRRMHRLFGDPAVSDTMPAVTLSAQRREPLLQPTKSGQLRAHANEVRFKQIVKERTHAHTASAAASR